MLDPCAETLDSVATTPTAASTAEMESAAIMRTEILACLMVAFRRVLSC
jgi:hypothetical protein